jgi:rubrerythrin
LFWSDEFLIWSQVQRSFHFALEAEKIHAQLFKAVQDAVKEEKDIGNF